MRPSVKLQAVFILILLSGHEAVRIHEAGNMTTGLSLENDENFEKPTEWEKKFKEMNKQCTSSDGYCFGRGCTFKYIPFDFGQDTWCRKSDEYLLKTQPVESVKMYAGILKSKSEKYNAKCQGRFSSLNPWCHRRLQYMFDAIKFLAYAQEKDGVAKEAVKDAFSDSMANLAGSFGEDGKLVEKLKDKVGSSRSIATNPEGSIKRMMTLIQKLTTGSKEEHDEAKAEIERSDAFEAIEDQDTQASQVSETEQLEPMDAEEEKEIQEAKDSMAQQLTDLETPLANSSSSSMLQGTNSEVNAKYMAGALFAVVAVGAAVLMAAAIAEILVGALIAYAVLSVFSCGLFHTGVWYGSNQKYEAGANQVKGMSKKTAVKNAAVCAGKFLLLPFKMVYYAGKWTVRGISYLVKKARGNSTKASTKAKSL